MISLLLYLFESSICLSILFGMYLLFFQRETFFEFNRHFLLGIMIFSLIVPIVHISFSSEKIHTVESSVLEIHKVRSYYSRLIALTDPNFRLSVDQTSYSKAFEDFPELMNTKNSTNINININSEETGLAGNVSSVSFNSKDYFPWIRIILWVYLTGIALFFFRLVGLLFWLIKTIRKNPRIRDGRFIIVQLQEEIPPFSFFRYVFVNKEVYEKQDFEKILAHECIHVRQRHSFDLLLAHSLNILQWFNPLAWQLQKAIKTNHEYLADKQVVDQGFELFDYQSLLLTQLISIRSVELVNNFNLLSIQKRIAMMTKIKSGFAAKLKVLLIVPCGIALFFFFANLTFKGSGRSFSNYVSFKHINEISKFQGIWENLDRQSYGRLLAFGANSLSILEDESNLKEFKAGMTKDKISLELWPGEVVELNYDFDGNVLQIWWSDSEPTRYKKVEQTNSLAWAIGSMANEIDLPAIEEYLLIDWPEYFNLAYTGKKLMVRDKEGNLADINRLLKNQKASLNKLAMKRMTVKLFIDRDVLMKDMDVIIQSLRDNNLFKVVFMAVPKNGKGSVLLSHAYGRTLRLPPLEGIEILSDDEIKERGISLFTIDAFDKNISPQKLRPQLMKIMKESQKYITRIEYNGLTRYTTVLAYYDLVFGLLNELRDEYALEHFKAGYNELTEFQQDEVRKRYPATIVLKNIDEELSVMQK